jgi:hypothetical protein
MIERYRGFVKANAVKLEPVFGTISNLGSEQSRTLVRDWLEGMRQIVRCVFWRKEYLEGLKDDGVRIPPWRQ